MADEEKNPDNNFQKYNSKQHRNIILLIGDSTMSRTADAMQSTFSNCKILKEQGRCAFSEYFETVGEMKLWPPPKGSGPLHYGRRYPGCQDCRGCNSKHWMCDNYIDIMYIGIEFAKDHTYQVYPYVTTQESIILEHFKKLRNVLLVFFTKSRIPAAT